MTDTAATSPSVPQAYRPLVLLVCTGNTCRSPMAACLLRNMVDRAGDALRVGSAGIWTIADQPAADEAIALMRQDGLDLSQHRSRMLTQQDIDNADLILVMERMQKENILLRFARAKDKLFLLSEMAGQSGSVADPHDGTHEDYVACKEEIEALLRKGYERIVQRAAGPAGRGRR